MIFVSRCVVIGYGLLSGVLAIALLKIGLSLGWVYLFMGVCVGSAVVPIAFSITWAKCSGFAAVCGAIGGLVGAVIAWVLTAHGLTGKVTIDTLGGDYPMLAGNLVAICLSGIICVVLSYMKPQNYNWAEMRDIPLGGWRGGAWGWQSPALVERAAGLPPAGLPRFLTRRGRCPLPTPAVEDDPMAFAAEGEDSPEALTKALRWTWMTGGALTLALVLMWPLLSLPAGVFNRGYFTMWIVIAMIWGLCASFCCIFAPIWESRKHIAKICSHLMSCSPAETQAEAFADTAKAVLPPSAAPADAAVHFDQAHKAAN
jgi:hypothetical protein